LKFIGLQATVVNVDDEMVRKGRVIVHLGEFRAILGRFLRFGVGVIFALFVLHFFAPASFPHFVSFHSKRGDETLPMPLIMPLNTVKCR